MIELARHIEILLLENDCVIVPELGGFIAHYQPAYYAESDNIYFPPMRTIGFNPQLTMNDDCWCSHTCRSIIQTFRMQPG